MSEPKEEPKQRLTPEEVEKRKADLTKFYKEQIEFLKVQFEFEELVTQIEDSKARRAMAMMKQAQIYAGPEEDQSEKQTEPEMIQPEEGVPKEPVFRKLKTDK